MAYSDLLQSYFGVSYFLLLYDQRDRLKRIHFLSYLQLKSFQTLLKTSGQVQSPQPAIQGPASPIFGPASDPSSIHSSLFAVPELFTSLYFSFSGPLPVIALQPTFLSLLLHLANFNPFLNIAQLLPFQEVFSDS